MEMVRHVTVAPVSSDFDSTVGTPVVVRSDTGAIYVKLDDGTLFEIAGATADVVGDVLTITSGSVTVKVQVVGGNTGVIGTTSNHPLLFYANNAERARVTANTRLLVGVTSENANGGSLQLAGGITFPAAQAAATDANTLDDYEEGTWTPADGSGAGLSLTVTDATYTKIGRLVFYRANITYPGTASGANSIISGLPFTVGLIGAGNIITAGTTTAVAAAAVAGTTTLWPYTNANVRVTNVQLNNANLFLTGSYEV